MRSFSNYRSERILLSKRSLEHIQSAHADISLDMISSCLADPDEVRKSTKNPKSEIYYLLRIERRFTCVVVKRCPDGNWISTAMTTTKPKFGETIYMRN